MADELVPRAPGSGDRGAPPAGGQESGAQTGDGRAWIGKNPEAAQRSQRRQAAQAWGGKVEAGRAAGGQVRGPRVCCDAAWPRVSLGGAERYALWPLSPSVLPSRSVLNAQPWFAGSPRSQAEASHHPQGRMVLFLFLFSFIFQIRHNEHTLLSWLEKQVLFK